ncbi:MAG: DEAD/DEAH box helicase family protein [Methylobacter sp.]
MTIVLGNQLFIDNRYLPTALQSRIIRLAAFQNPEFYKNQAMRLSTFGKPRIISCAEYYSQHIALPRGCLDDLINLLVELKIKPVIQDERFSGDNIPDLQFLGRLTDEQTQAANKLLEHDIGTLSATTAFGKTVVALHILANRQVNTLIIAHRRQLLDQWLERIELFLNVSKKQVGKIGGGKNKLTGIIDVAIMQSLTKNQTVDDVVANYGQIIFDECHHLSAVSFESVAKAYKAKYVLGLSATLTRKDGHHPIVFMQCGPVRHQASAKQQALVRPFDHYVTQRQTAFIMHENTNTDNQSSIHEIYQALVVDEQRNQFILEDIKQALTEGRSPIVLKSMCCYWPSRSAHLQKMFSLCKVVWASGNASNCKTAYKVFPTMKNGLLLRQDAIWAKVLTIPDWTRYFWLCRFLGKVPWPNMLVVCTDYIMQKPKSGFTIMLIATCRC